MLIFGQKHILHRQQTPLLAVSNEVDQEVLRNIMLMPPKHNAGQNQHKDS